ncbi:MAG: hypothetical protein LBU23_09435 [Planctomycetota bacterium]|nr:hypothetical protein [Planctomycetota bacterium]
MALDNGKAGDGKIDTNNLYRQETYTDLGLGSIQCLLPITADGGPDAARQPIFMGSAQIMTPHGPIPVQCEIPAGNLRAACEAFPKAIEAAVNDLVREARQLERERQGGIVIPRGGKIELP